MAPRSAFQDATCADRQRHAGACVQCATRRRDSHGTTDEAKQATKLALAEQVFTDLLWALAENSAQTDQVKRKSAKRETKTALFKGKNRFAVWGVTLKTHKKRLQRFAKVQR